MDYNEGKVKSYIDNMKKPLMNIIRGFEFKPGQTYYIQYMPTWSGPSIQLVSQAEGREAIKGLKNTGNINPADVLSDYDESEAYKELDTSTREAPL